MSTNLKKGVTTCIALGQGDTGWFTESTFDNARYCCLDRKISGSPCSYTGCIL